MSVGNRIRQRRLELGLSGEEVGKMLGVNKTTVYRYEKGEIDKMPIEVVEKLSVALRTTPDVIMGWNTDASTPTNLVPINRASIVSIPILGTIKCGQPILAEENITGYREELSDRLPSGNLFYLRSQGDSMLPTIPEGSLVLIREQPTVEYGEVAAVLVNGDTEATLKRVKKQGDIVMLIADNPDYPPYVITKDNPARIIGKAVLVSTEL
ncbi:XRE family transcriptional regulator [uncultured Abiotrophia sp.]|uniref:LexA family protein n=1 Tax=uncultured Abiotrophia sp. TaxID=316094 RepID=UPI0028D6EC56|nr:XRE family transcriptional regulator [uncultured Abiotrophia sp.]